MSGTRVLIPVRACAYPPCASPFRPGRLDQECCTPRCATRLVRYHHPSQVARRKGARPLVTCTHPGCALRTRSETGLCGGHNGRHGRVPTVIGRVDTEAAGRTTCPRCGGPIRIDGLLASCLDRSEHSGETCGWTELTRRVVRRVTP